MSFALRQLPPADRARYREEWRAELVDLPRVDQAAYAFRLVCRARALRRSLAGKRAVKPARLAVLSIGISTETWAVLAAADWPAVVLGAMLIAAGLWTVGSSARTERLAAIIKAARGEGSPDKGT